MYSTDDQYNTFLKIISLYYRYKYLNTHNIYIYIYKCSFYPLFYVYRRPGILVLINDIDWELLVNIKIIIFYIYILCIYNYYISCVYVQRICIVFARVGHFIFVSLIQGF